MGHREVEREGIHHVRRTRATRNFGGDSVAGWQRDGLCSTCARADGKGLCLVRSLARDSNTQTPGAIA